MFYLGIDVSKAKLDCCIYPQGLTGKRKNKVFPNVKNGFAKLREWLTGLGADLSQTTVVMEATSVYHENLAYDLYDAGLKVCIANPARVRAFARSLSMLNMRSTASQVRVDSEALVRYAMTAALEFWQPTPAKVRLLKDLLDRRAAIADHLFQETNRLEKAVSAQTSAIVRQLLDESIEHLRTKLKEIDRLISEYVDKDPDLKNDLDLLTSIPAIGERTGLLMLGLFHSHQFEKASQAAAYVGVVPVQYQSGSSVKRRSRMSKAGSSKVRAGLYMAAVVAIRHNPHISAMYQRLCENGKSKMAAIGAAMRKLIHLCYGVLKHQIPYQADYLTAKPA